MSAPSVNTEQIQLGFMQKYAYPPSPLRRQSSDVQSSNSQSEQISPEFDNYLTDRIMSYYYWRFKPLQLKILILYIIIIILIGVISYFGYEMFNQHKDIKNIKQNNEQLIKLNNSTN